MEPFAQNKRVLDLIPPEEETMSSGTACEWGIVRLQLYPARPGAGHTAPKDYVPLAGVGDAAFFNASRTFAYLYVWSGSHHFVIEMGGIPLEDARTMKPNVIALAKSIVPQLR